MPGRNDGVIYQSNSCANGSKRRGNDEHRTILRHKRIRTGSGNHIDSNDNESHVNPIRRNRRNTSHIESPKVLQSACILDPYQDESPSSSALRDSGNQRHITVNRLEGLDEENSLASSVFVDHQLLNTCNSPKDSIIENAECLLDKADTSGVVCVVNVNDSEPPNPCETAELLIQEDENIDTSTNAENDAVGSTDGEDDDCDCTSKSGYNDDPSATLERQNTIELLGNDDSSTLIVDTVDRLNRRDSADTISESSNAGPSLSKHPTLLISQSHYPSCSDTLNQSLSSVSSSPSTASLCALRDKVGSSVGLSAYSNNNNKSYMGHKPSLNKSSTESSLESHKMDSIASCNDESDKSCETSSSQSFNYNINSRHSCDLGLIRSSNCTELSPSKESYNNSCQPKSQPNDRTLSPKENCKRPATRSSVSRKKGRKSVNQNNSYTSDNESTQSCQNCASSVCTSSINEPHIYPLRSRIRRESLKKQLQARHNSPKTFDQLPTEILLKIVHYLNVQDLFRSQRVSKRMRDVVDCYLQLVKRINFSSGLPFAFLPESLDNGALKRILTRTPKVTHILGFYPKTIHGAYAYENNRQAEDSPNGGLTYSGIIDAFTCCTKLRSVELMDVELMSRLVQCLPLVKFHGMFRNRPDSWDSEYALPMPPEPSTERVNRADPPNVNFDSRSVVNPLAAITPLYGCHVGTLFGAVSAATTSSENSASSVSPQLNDCTINSCSNSSLAHIAASYAQNAAIKASRLAGWFEPLSEAPIGHGSPSNSLQHFETHLPHTQNQPGLLQNVHALGPRLLNIVAAAAVQQNPPVPGQPVPMAVIDQHNQPVMPEFILAAGALQNNPHMQQQQQPYPQDNANNPMFAFAFAAAINMQRRRAPFFLIRGGPPEAAPQQNRTHRRYPALSNPQDSYSRNFHRKFISPLPCIWSNMSVMLPNSITNLTKLDLVSVSINNLPRLDNIKYLHLKWIVFKQSDPFYYFLAPKLQSFVMNNCVGPLKAVRFVRVFTALSKALGLSRLELVGCRFVEGLIEHIVENGLVNARAFRHLQRLVLSGNKDASEIDLGLLLVAGHQSLAHLALPTGHARNALFEALVHARLRFPRLESLTLGHQDPYQSRLTASELASLSLVDAWDAQLPLCSITDRGISLCLRLCPRLTCLVLKHAPYVERLEDWNLPNLEGNRNEERNEEVLPDNLEHGQDTFLPLRSLTLENCPNITIENLENAIYKGKLFPCLDTIVLRDMFFAKCGVEDFAVGRRPWNEKWLHLEDDQMSIDSEKLPDYRNCSLLLALADSLFACRLGFPPLSPAGVGLGSSVRDISIHPSGNNRMNNSLNTYELFMSVRLHTYMSSITQLDGTCGRNTIGRMIDGESVMHRVLMGDIPLYFQMKPSASTAKESVSSKKSDFVSQGTQTCICGLLEVDALAKLQCDSQDNKKSQSQKSSHIHDPQDPHGYFRGVHQLEGPLAFHPFVPSALHMRLYSLHVASNWSDEVHPILQKIYSLRDSESSHVLLSDREPTSKVRSSIGDHSSNKSSLGSYGCLPLKNSINHSHQCIVCSSNPSEVLTSSSDITNSSISASQVENDYGHRPRHWIARDACLDTSELRCHTGAHIAPLTIHARPLPLSPASCLTTIHFEKVGISHLILGNAPRLKNLTLENCPDLRGIILWKGGSGEKDIQTSVQSLRRVRIIRCPKFAIYHWLSQVISLYPSHDENMFITYRPFGEYNPVVERILWEQLKTAHVMISSDYKQKESERNMEDFHSSFDQLFREVMNFSDMLIRREFIQTHYPEGTNWSTKSESGTDWELVTDVPWIHEVCCSMLPNCTADVGRTEQADQLYELLSEVQSANLINTTRRDHGKSWKLARRGVHFHVQYRDVHGRSEPDPAKNASNVEHSSNWMHGTSNSASYMKYAYDESYTSNVSAQNDLNVFGDGLDYAHANGLPPRDKLPQSTSSPCIDPTDNLTTWERLLLLQEDEQEKQSVESAAQHATHEHNWRSPSSHEVPLNSGCRKRSSLVALNQFAPGRHPVNEMPTKKRRMTITTASVEEVATNCRKC